MKRLLMLTPVAERNFVGGLQLALQDLQRELENRGWSVEAPIYRDPHDKLAPSVPPTSKWIAAIQKSATLLKLRRRIPASLRLTISSLLQSPASFQLAARNLQWAEDKLRDPTQYDAVLVCPDCNIRGILSLAIARHPNVAVLSLAALAEELRPTLWSLVRLRRKHPFHYVPAQPAGIQTAIFASRKWREQAIEAGLSPNAAHVIYFGIPIHEVPNRPAPAHRLLWLGRLTPEKGLHILLEALPHLLQKSPNVTLTAVAAQGEPTYRQLITQTVQSKNLDKVVTILPPVPREKLQELYTSHDALFFYSINEEPVALALMEAFAAKLPVAANHANSDLIEDKVTCLTYNPNDPQDIAQTLQKLLTNPQLTANLTQTARTRIEQNYTLPAMATAFDSLLQKPNPA